MATRNDWQASHHARPPDSQYFAAGQTFTWNKTARAWQHIWIIRYKKRKENNNRVNNVCQHYSRWTVTDNVQLYFSRCCFYFAHCIWCKRFTYTYLLILSLTVRIVPNAHTVSYLFLYNDTCSWRCVRMTCRVRIALIPTSRWNWCMLRLNAN